MLSIPLRTGTFKQGIFTNIYNDRNQHERTYLETQMSNTEACINMGPEAPNKADVSFISQR